MVNRVKSFNLFNFIPAVHNSNISLIYTIELSLNLLDFNPKYPKNPKTLGEKIRKARMDKALKIKDLARLIGVTPDSIINWEIRGLKPRERSFKKLAIALDFSKNLVYNYSVA